MSNWQNYFDRIYAISLPEAGRRERLSKDMKEFGIDFRYVDGWPDDNGQRGVYKTLMSLFRLMGHTSFSRILVFEDDVMFKESPIFFNLIMREIVSQARTLDWLQLKLGSVLLREPNGLITPNLFKIEGSYGLHACAYTREFMELALSLPEELPVDVSWQKHIESLGRSYHSYPLLCSQYEGYSSIEKCNKAWDFNITGTFNKYTQKIKAQYEVVYGNNNI